MLKIETLETDAATQAEARRRQAEMIYGGDECDAPRVDFADAEAAPKFVITKLTAGVRDPNRVNVFLNGKFAFSLDMAQVVDFGLKTNQEISAEKLLELKRASEFGKLYQRTLEWVLTRPHAIRETRDYLKRRKFKRQILNRQRAKDGLKLLAEFDDDLAELVVARLIEKKYLDDAKFAKFYVENRHVRRGISQKRLKMELAQKGVSEEIIAAALAEMPRDEDDELRKMIAKKRKKYDDYKLIGYLTRQGFDFQRAKDAVENYHED